MEIRPPLLSVVVFFLSDFSLFNQFDEIPLAVDKILKATSRLQASVPQKPFSY